jgi:gliding motility-associated-like protein
MHNCNRQHFTYIRNYSIFLSFIFLFLGHNLYADGHTPQQSRQDDLEIHLIYTDEVCYGATGNIRLFIQHGTPPYDFQWSNGATTQDIYNVLPGTYQVTVTDGTGAEVVETAILHELPYMGSQIVINAQDVLCHGGSTGEISTYFNNDTGPYAYFWSTGSAASGIHHLAADAYSVTITDAYACQFDTTIYISEPDTILMNAFTSPATCYGSMDGKAWLEVYGGVPIDTTAQGYVYNYHWPNGVNNDTITYYGGTYTVSVSDANGCFVQTNFTIDQPSQILALQAGNPQICIGGEANLTSEVTGGSAPYLYYWINTSTNDTIFSNSITVSPEVTTQYYFYAKDMNGCFSNTVNSTVNVYPELLINSMVISADSVCKEEGVTVDIDIEGGNGGPYQITFDGNQIVSSPFTFYPTSSDTFTVKIQDQCSTPAVETSFDIVVMPDPPVGFTVDKHQACPPELFSFNEFSEDVGQSYRWDFGDNQFSMDKNPVHLYTESGRYDVALTVTSDFGCKKTKVMENLVTIHPKPEAEFYVNSNNASILAPVIQFFNSSANADSIYWYFGDGDSTLYSHANPWHEFPGIGWYSVQMIAENDHGCADTTFKSIRIFDEYTFNAPTAFTPNNDGINDCFRLCGHGIDILEFHMRIYDRLGSLVFETKEFVNDQECSACGEGAWDGTYDGSYVKGDELCEPGEYVWFCVYKDIEGVDNVAQGKVLLFR